MEYPTIISLKKEKIILPIGFFEKVENSKELYLEALKSYLYNLPNSSLIQIVRCGEIVIRKRLEIDDSTFITIKMVNINFYICIKLLLIIDSKPVRLSLEM